MTQVITLTNTLEYDSKNYLIFYQTTHENNARYLEREGEPEKFKILWNIDDASPTFIQKSDRIVQLMCDLEVVLKEAHENSDHGMCNHLREIFVLCKMCLWGEGKLALEFSPWGNVSANAPKELPDKYKINISALG